MCVAVLGGMDRLSPHYKNEAKRHGIKLKIYSREENNLDAKLKNVDALLIFTNKISHKARNRALQAVKGRDIQVLQMHSCGVCSLRDCLNCLAAGGTRKTC